MKLWNIFRMEMFKNINDKMNLIVMVVLACINTIGGLILSNLSLFREPTGFETAMLLLFAFSVLASVLFLFIYPFQMLRRDYKNKVVSLMLASGVSRIQFYFVKIISTLLFSFLSITAVVIVPLFIVLLTNNMAVALNFFGISFEIDFGIVFILLLGWLSSFVTLMTSVIITKGRGVAIFAYFGINITESQINMIFQNIFNVGIFDLNITYLIFQSLISILIISSIGIFVLRKQDL